MKSTALLRVLSLLLGALLCIGLLAASATQEVPLGSVEGTVTMAENNKPLPKAWVVLQYMGGGGGYEYGHTWRYRTDKQGQFRAVNIPAGVYSIEADAKAHSAKRRSMIVTEGKTEQMPLALKANEPYLDLYASQRVFSPGDRPSFEIRGFDPAGSAKVSYYKLDLGKIVAKGGLSTLLYSFSRPGNEGGADPSKSSTSSGSFEKKLNSKDVEGVFTEPVTLPKLGEGFYYVRCKVGGESRATYLNVSTIGLVTKTVARQALCYVCDLTSGKPIGGALIQTPVGTGLSQIGKTGQDGTLAVTLPESEAAKALLLASYGRSQAVVDFDDMTYPPGDRSRIFIYSDRPIYRPGDTVQFKGIIRNLKGLNYAMPAAGNVQIEIRDADETAIQKFALPITRFGTFHGSFSSNVEDKPGVYSIHASYNNAEYTYWVNVAAYRKPEFSIKVTSNKGYYFYGDKASATVKAEYYFGGPVVGAKVSAFVTRSTHYSYEDEFDTDSDYDTDESGNGAYYNREFQGEYYQEVDAVTNEKGEAVISFDTKQDGDPAVPDYDLDYTINASITDASNKYFDGSGTVTVVRGDISADLNVDTYVARPGDTVNARIKVEQQDGAKPVPNWPVSLVVGSEKWDGDTATFVPKETLAGQTDEHGVAVIPFKVTTEDSIVLKSTVKDSVGRPVTSEQYVYVEGAEFSGPSTSNFTLTLDKRSYKTGDTCRALIQTDHPGGAALVTVQAEKILKTYVVDLTSQATTVSIPVLHEYSPNVWISAVAVRNKQLDQAESRLTVNVRDHDLNVTITPDRSDYKPGDTASLTVKTTNAEGQPVPADLSLGVVDESIYALRPDTTNIKSGFYPMRSDYVQTNYSFEEIYLDGGDKAGGDLQVRTKFLDTAAWIPDVQTDTTGTGHTSIKLPDNLTSWRATAVGVTDETQVGMAHVNFIANKPLTIRLELPSFLVQQDTQQITTIVTNNTDRDQDVTVRLDAQGIDVDGQLSAQVHVTSAKPVSLKWNLHTPRSGTARLTAYAIAGNLNDAESRSLTIEPHARLVQETHSGEIKDGERATFSLSPTADPSSSRLTVELTPSVGSSIYQSLDQLIDFPYGCTEQTMSRFLPAVVLSSVLKTMNVRTDLQAKVPAIVNDGFARLAKMQHSNGAWGWWEYDDADMFMTAYVLDGLHRAKGAGYISHRINIKSAVQWAATQMKGAKLDKYNSRDFLYLCYATALYGDKKQAAVGLKRAKPRGASELALVAMIDDLLGDVAGRDEALADLHNQIRVEGDFAHFEGQLWDYGEESVAFPLIALTTITPQDPFIPMIVRYLMVTRQGAMWYSTRDTSLALIGLTQHMGTVKDLGQPLDVQIKVNGGEPRRIHVDPEAAFTSDLEVTIPAEELKAGPNTIEFRRVGGQGTCFYSGELKQRVVEDKLMPLRATSGLTIQRNYYLLEPQRLENGTMTLAPSRRSIDQAQSGDLIRVELTISSEADEQFVMVEDPIPSGCRITEREYVDPSETWTNWWSQTIVRDDRAAFFMRWLPKGVQKLTYTMRAEQVGVGHALPPTISNMYDPSLNASGGETVLQVTP